MSLVVTLALRNVAVHRTKSLIVGAIMAFGTALVVVGLALLDGSEAAMRASITGSVSGDLQLYDAEARDPLVLLGSSFIAVPDVGRIDRFEAVAEVVEALPEVEAVVPMGFSIGNVSTPGALDRVVGAYRRALEGSPAERARAAEAVRGLAAELRAELTQRKAVAADVEAVEAERALLARFAPGGEVWDEPDPRAVLERLETQLAPLDDGGEQLLFRFLGTDLGLFGQHFDGFSIVKGGPVPDGRRGFLFSDKFYERRIKHRVARALDRIAERRDDGELVDEDPGQRARVRRVARQWRRITRQLDEREAREVSEGLRAYFAERDVPAEGDLSELLQAFLTVDDATLDERRELFYDLVGPRIELYALHPGDVLTVRSYTQSGFLRSVNVTFHGTFTFAGLESSDLAGIYNMMDLMTFRHLYGVMSTEEKAELADLRAQVELTEAETRDELEASLFGGEAAVEAPAPAAVMAEIEEASFGGVEERGLPRAIPPGTQRRGMVIDAAVVFGDGVDPAIGERAVKRAIADAGLPVQVTDWQAAAGLIGQFVTVVRLVLYVAVAVIFLVAVVIINNAMVMAMMERVKEVGTLRAIGAQRGFVMAMVFFETMSLGAVAGALGAGLGAGLVGYWGRFGLPAANRELEFVFGGPYLYPEIAAYHVAAALLAVLVVSVASTAYPAFLGASVAPVEAMRTEE